MSFSRILLALSVIFALSFVASAAPITLPSLEDLQNRNPQDYYQYNSGRGNYENYSQTRLTTPTSSTERFSGNLGNWNYSNSRGYSITPDWFSISGGDYNWNSFNDWQGR